MGASSSKRPTMSCTEAGSGRPALIRCGQVGLQDARDADGGSRHAAADADCVGHFRARAGEQSFQTAVRGVMRRIGQFRGPAATEATGSARVPQVPAEEVEDRILGFLVFDIRHVGRGVEHDASGIDAIVVGAGAAAAAEVAHLGRRKGKAMLARAGEDRRHRSSRPHGHRLFPVTLARQQQLRQTAPGGVDRDDDGGDRGHGAGRRIGAVVDRSHGERCRDNRARPDSTEYPSTG